LAAAEPAAEEAICCFCLEALPPPTQPGETAMRMICCGNEYCLSCDQNWEEQGSFQGCPFCRAPLPCGDQEKVALIRAKAEQGKGYAIFLMGEMHKLGLLGVECSLTLAIEWLSKGDPWCTWLLGTCYEVDSHLDHAKAFGLFLVRLPRQTYRWPTQRSPHVTLLGVAPSKTMRKACSCSQKPLDRENWQAWLSWP